MQETKNSLFNILLGFTILLLSYIIFHYDKNYWVNFFSNRETLPSEYIWFLHIIQISCVILILILILFRNKIYEKRKHILLLIFTVAFTFILLEVASRVYICHFASSAVQINFLVYGQCGILPQYSPHPYFDYYGSPNYISPNGLNIHNSLGLRGSEIMVPKPEGVYRLAVLGGSTTYEWGIKDWKNDWARQLERELQNKYNYSKIEVINAGLGGWGSWESLSQLEFLLLDLDLDMIIIYHGVNDIHPRLINPEYYQGDNIGWRKSWTPKSIPLVLRSTFVRLVTQLNPTGLDQFVYASTAKDYLNEEAGFIPELNGTLIETLQKNKPTYFERNTRNMIAIAKENNISVLLSTWAFTNQFYDYINTSHYQYGIEENNKIIKEIGLSHKVPVYDFAKEMPKDKKYWFDGRHANEEGVKLKAKLFADYIYKNKLIDRSINKLKSF